MKSNTQASLFPVQYLPYLQLPPAVDNTFFPDAHVFLKIVVIAAVAAIQKITFPTALHAVVVAALNTLANIFHQEITPVSGMLVIITVVAGLLNDGLAQYFVELCPFPQRFS